MSDTYYCEHCKQALSFGADGATKVRTRLIAIRDGRVEMTCPGCKRSTRLPLRESAEDVAAMKPVRYTARPPNPRRRRVVIPQPPPSSE